jgi:hypothetical protein
MELGQSDLKQRKPENGQFPICGFLRIFADFAHICGFVAHNSGQIFPSFFRKKVKANPHMQIYSSIFLPKGFRVDRLQQADGRRLPTLPPMRKESPALALMQVSSTA